MMSWRRLLEEVGDDVFDIHECDVKVAVHYYFVGFALVAEFFFGLFDALLEAVFALGIAIGEAARQCFFIRWCDEDDECVIAVLFLDAVGAFHIDVVEYDLAFGPDAVDFALQ